MNGLSVLNRTAPHSRYICAVSSAIVLLSRYLLGGIMPLIQSTKRPPPLCRRGPTIHRYRRVQALLRRLGADLEVPVENLRAVPEQNIFLLADLLEDLAEVFHPVRRAHDVGVNRKRHHAGAVLRVFIYLLELI